MTPTPAMQKCCGQPPASVFFGFLRSGEIVCPSENVFDPLSHLCFGDVKVDNQSTPSAIQVTIKASKTDPFRQGVTLHMDILHLSESMQSTKLLIPRRLRYHILATRVGFVQGLQDLWL